MTELSTTQLLGAKSLATEVILLALLREKREDTAFWNSLDKVAQIIFSLEPMGSTTDPMLQQQREQAQVFLDSWRDIAGKNPNDPAPPGSGPFVPPQGG